MDGPELRHEENAAKGPLVPPPVENYTAPKQCPRCGGPVSQRDGSFPSCLMCAWEDYRMPTTSGSNYSLVGVADATFTIEPFHNGVPSTRYSVAGERAAEG